MSLSQAIMLSPDNNLKDDDDITTTTPEDEISENQTTSNDSSKDVRVVVENGRVLRKSSVTSRKNATGPVLRATVKPVKRFRPDGSTNSPSESLLIILFGC